MKMISLIPAALAVAMVCVALIFSYYRGERIKDCLAKLWSARRREVLNLETRNGFYFFMELLMRLSQRLLWVAAFFVFLLGAFASTSFSLAALAVSAAFAWRAGVLWFIAHHRIKVFEELLAADGAGCYGLARKDWCTREKAARSALLGVSVVVLAAIYILITSPKS